MSPDHVRVTSEAAAWYDIATSFIDIISDCTERQGLGGRQNTGKEPLKYDLNVVLLI